MVNKVILIGNLGAAPEIRHLESGSTVGRFSLATNESYKDKSGEWQDITEWHNVVVWRSLAERAEKSLQKGTMVYLEGKLTHRKWQDKDGNNRYTTEVVASYFRVINRGANTGGYSDNFPDEENQYAQVTRESGSANPSDGPVSTSTQDDETKIGSETGGDQKDDLPF